MRNSITLVGMSIARRGLGFEPVLVFEDLSYKFIYHEDAFVMTSAEAIRDGRSLARAHQMPFRSRISAFKSLIREDSSNA